MAELVVDRPWADSITFPVRRDAELQPRRADVTGRSHAGESCNKSEPLRWRSLLVAALQSGARTKRVCDVSLTLVGGMACLPLVAVIVLAVKLTSRGPIFFGHERIGRYGRRFRALKFRTMVTNGDEVLAAYLESNPDAQEEWCRNHKLRRDPRITAVGRILRVTSLDELPQLWNVLRGDMSLIGPRPIVQAEISKYGEDFDLYLQALPGITGLWQVSGRNNTSYRQRVSLDVEYVVTWSLWMDLLILLRTALVVVCRTGAY